MNSIWETRGPTGARIPKNTEGLASPTSVEPRGPRVAPLQTPGEGHTWVAYRTPVTTTASVVSVTVNFLRGSTAGPCTTSPCAVKMELWQ